MSMTYNWSQTPMKICELHIPLKNKYYLHMKIERYLKDSIAEKLFKNKAIIVIGARQIGKTTLLNELLSSYENTLFLDGDDRITRALLQNPSTEEIKNIIGNHKIVFIDEVQRINNIGLTSKIIVDQFKEVQLLLSGSSAFDIKNVTSESLTGRKWEYNMYPITWKELENTAGYVKGMQQLDLRLVYGSIRRERTTKTASR
jgi:hypothetical protein